MASCSLGASNIKIPTLNSNKVRVGSLPQWNDVRPWIRQKPLQCAVLAISQQQVKALSVRCGPSLESNPVTNSKDDFEGTKSSGLTSQLIPNSSEVESLVTEICDSTSIAEFELKLGGFRLYMKRELTEKSTPPPPTNPAPVTANSTVESLNSNGSVSAPSLAITKLAYSSGGIQTLLDKAADEGLAILQSPKVGFFRRSRTIKGKRTPPSCKEKQIVKEGQVLCYIEQLGGEIPIESDVSGEVVKILREDGEPVGYNDALIAVLPSFPGIKKLQ